MVKGLSDVGQLEIACLLLAIIFIGALVMFTDLTVTPVKIPRSQQQAWAAAKVLEQARRCRIRE